MTSPTTTNGLPQPGPIPPAPVAPQDVQDALPQQQLGVPVGTFTLGDWLKQRKGRPVPAWQRRTKQVAGVVVVGFLGLTVVGRYTSSKADSAAKAQAAALRDYVDHDFAAQLGADTKAYVDETVAKGVANGPKTLVSSNPLEVAVPCPLSGEARRMIGGEPATGNTTLNVAVSQTLAQQARQYMATDGVNPKQLRIYDAGDGNVAISLDPTAGASLLDLAVCGKS